jgi:hypothetical protein
MSDDITYLDGLQQRDEQNGKVKVQRFFVVTFGKRTQDELHKLERLRIHWAKARSDFFEGKQFGS